MSSTPSPPVPAQVPFQHQDPFGVRADEYHWMRDKTNPDLISYLEAENEYAKKMMQSEELEQQLFKEMKDRMKETDLSVPYRKGKYMYYTRTQEGLQYRIHCRAPWDPTTATSSVSVDEPRPDEQVLLDVNAEAEGHEYCTVGDLSVSPDGRLLAYSLDYEGDEKHVLRVKEIESGHTFEDKIVDVSYGVEWTADSSSFFYVTMDDALRPYRVHRHSLGSSEESDTIEVEEPDERFYVCLDTTMDERYIIVSLDSQITSEVHIMPSDASSPFKCFMEREHGVEYSVDSHENKWLILSNANDCKNFTLFSCPITESIAVSPSDFTELIAHSRDVKLNYVVPFKSHVVVSQRRLGLPQLQIIELPSFESHFITFPESSYSCSTTCNYEYDTNTVRLKYSSQVSPKTTYDYCMESRTMTVLKEEEVLGGYDRSLYDTKRITATAEDGTEVPISLVFKKGTPQDGSAPLVMWGYGAYGMSYDASFDSALFSLIDRGVTCAIAHIRGGGDNGRYWYEDGKLFKKKNTFTDFLACAKHLSAEKYTSPENMAVYGASAGGLLIGAAINEAGDSLFSTAIARVPFVDIVSTLLDTSLPLTVVEWEEWGNPNEEAEYAYIRSYSPYDNVRAQRYPRVLLKAGLNDPRVSYWEPAKLAARLRALKTDSHPLLLKTNMGSGHFGSSGRYDHLKETAFEYAYLLKQFGLV